MTRLGCRESALRESRGETESPELDPPGEAMYGRERVHGQATKSTWWMPWRQEAKKDVTTCEKRRGAGSERRAVDVRMGKPGTRHGVSSCTKYIGV